MGLSNTLVGLRSKSDSAHTYHHNVIRCQPRPAHESLDCAGYLRCELSQHDWHTDTGKPLPRGSPKGLLIGEAMKLQRLPNRLTAIATTRLPTLQTKAGTTPRIRGDAWMATRRRIQQRDKFTCACCGLVRMDHEVDHRVPLEQGGTNDDDNLQLLCGGSDRCHAAKTAAEAKERAGK